MDESKIARINELYHKSKEVGLSDAELKEQLILRKEYIAQTAFFPDAASFQLSL